MSSTAFFAAHQENPKKVDALLLEPDRLLWEQETCSNLSPGPVEGAEVLCRQVVNPVHVEIDGSLKPTAFSDCMNKGMSVDRAAHTTDAEVIERGQRRAEQANERNRGTGKKPSSLHAVTSFVAGQIREHKFEGEQALAVYDTAQDDNHSHADICMVIARTDQSKRSVRAYLFELAEMRTVLVSEM